ncbi:MAG: hypothetical protein BA872_08165 [Desulfobacterales bacterium C00003060]|nr:MAG: hypothetical protein BA861_10630 [Desulfobacterales bacterium S3730MH5]OEU77845.1 MAG: hypothetical protein BA865_08495 [Desulfobacterales bacterium S5133MH4]OEU80852.1 MAG: hypothetical protein BA872_08165 [Desulfobacterales bacterium C00003060]
MKVTCDTCGCDMKITSTFKYHCPQCNNGIEMVDIQEANQEYRDKHNKNIEWAKIKGNDVIVVE